MSDAVRLNLLDTAWLFTESRATPNHVGGLLQFRLPEDASKHYLRDLMLEFRASREFAPPWNRRLKTAFSMNPMPAWIVDDKIDLEYHVRHAALPWPGGERELGELVGRLQSSPLDLTRPPWECTIIEGLSDNRFALFIKMHHSLIDGISGMKLMERALATDARKSNTLLPFWCGPSRPSGKPERHRAAPTMANATAAAIEGLSAQAKSLPQLAAAFGKIIKRIGDPGEGMAVPFDSPRSILNGRVREKRRFATQQFAMTRLRAVADAGGSTLNDVVLALCGGALRRFLLELDALPEQSLTAGIPVSVRPKEDEATGNAITFIVATLGTDIEDASERLQSIRRSVQHAKAHVQSLPRQAMLQYTVMLMAPTLITLLTGIGGRTPPMFNITISNVPGPDKPLFFKGAELLSIYPASIITHGQALNITCESYAGQMNFGFTACHSSVPSMQRLAVYAADALAELEGALLPTAKKARTASTKRTDGAATAAQRSTAVAEPMARRRTTKAATKRPLAAAKPATKRAKPSVAAT